MLVGKLYEDVDEAVGNPGVPVPVGMPVGCTDVPVIVGKSARRALIGTRFSAAGRPATRAAKPSAIMAVNCILRLM